MVRVAAIQLNSQADVGQNLADIAALVADAAGRGCEMAFLPENFALMPVRGRDKNQHAEEPGKGPVQDCLSKLARQHSIWIVGGSLPLKSPDAERVFGATVVVDSDGSCQSIYRKIHLFDVDLAAAGEAYRESHSMYPGNSPAVVDTPIGRLGLTICYDLRFPELFRALVDDGATAFSVPAAFTAATGKAHWHTLLRARAIENLAWVIAPGQTGSHPDGRATYGHSLICDPWGEIAAEVTDGTGMAVADIDGDRVQQLRAEFPALSNRRLARLTIN